MGGEVVAEAKLNVLQSAWKTGKSCSNKEFSEFFCWCWGCLFFFKNKKQEFHWYITLLSQGLSSVFSVSSNSRIEEEIGVTVPKGALPSSLSLIPLPQPLANTSMLQEFSVPRFTVERGHYVSFPTSWSITHSWVIYFPLWLLSLIS